MGEWVRGKEWADSRRAKDYAEDRGIVQRCDCVIVYVCMYVSMFVCMIVEGMDGWMD